jgi:hypothetical protein
VVHTVTTVFWSANWQHPRLCLCFYRGRTKGRVKRKFSYFYSDSIYWRFCMSGSQTNTRRLLIFHLADLRLFFLKDPQFLWYRGQSGAVEHSTDQHNLWCSQLIKDRPPSGHTTARLCTTREQTVMAAFKVVSTPWRAEHSFSRCVSSYSGSRMSCRFIGSVIR